MYRAGRHLGAFGNTQPGTLEHQAWQVVLTPEGMDHVEPGQQPPDGSRGSGPA